MTSQCGALDRLQRQRAVCGDLDIERTVGGKRYGAKLNADRADVDVNGLGRLDRKGASFVDADGLYAFCVRGGVLRVENVLAVQETGFIEPAFRGGVDHRGHHRGLLASAQMHHRMNTGHREDGSGGVVLRVENDDLILPFGGALSMHAWTLRAF